MKKIFILFVFLMLLTPVTTASLFTQSTMLSLVKEDTHTELGPLPIRSWWNSSWMYRKQVIIDHTKVTGDLVNFPILVKTTLDTNKVQNDGDDLVFTSDAGSKLHHEIEFYNSVSGELIAWVNVTSISATVDTILWMYYGNPGCSNQQNAESTWNAGYTGVWHLRESFGTRYDSTSNNKDCAASATTHTTSAKIDGGEIYDANADMIYTTTTIASMSSYTLESWFRFSSATGGTGDDIMYIRQNNPVVFRYTDEKIHVWVNGNYELLTSTHVFDDMNWHYVVLLATGTVMQLFVDSNLEAYTTWTGSTSTNNFCLGDNWLGTDTFRGTIDESRISHTARSLNWIYTSYNTVNLSSTFINVGPEQGRSIPHANFTYTPENPTNTTLIHFTDTSTDTNGTIVSWWWDFGDDSYSDEQNPDHCYYSDGNYTVILEVTDNYDETNSTQKIITVYTPPNQPPYIPSNPVPQNGAEDVPITTNLSWTGGDPDGDQVTYDVHFGTAFPPPKIMANQSATSYDLGLLLYNTTYYWKIVSWDDQSNNANSPLWQFTTTQNSAPGAPTINGPPSGKIGRVYRYTFITTDPEDNDILYEIDWGDGVVDEWYGPVSSDLVITRDHTWDEKGTYTIKARAKDIHGATGDWGSLEVSMPCSFDIPIMQLWEHILQRFPHLLPLLRVLIGI